MIFSSEKKKTLIFSSILLIGLIITTYSTRAFSLSQDNPKSEQNLQVGASTYFGGNNFEGIFARVLDNENSFIFGGITNSNNFPWKSSIQIGTQSSPTGYITKFSENGELIFNMPLSGNSFDLVSGLITDVDGFIYGVGETESTDLPVINPIQNEFGGQSDFFVFKISPDGELLWLTYFGGSNIDEFPRITLDSENNIYVLGITSSDDYPTTLNAHQPNFGGNYDNVLTKISSNGELIWSTYLGDLNYDEVGRLLIDSQDNIIVAFTVEVTNSNIRLFGEIQTNKNIKIYKISPSGSVLWEKNFGGTKNENYFSLKLLPNDDISITGTTLSVDFPTNYSYISSNSANLNGFFAKFDQSGNLDFSSLFGGSETDLATRQVFDPSRGYFVVGTSNSADFPNINVNQTETIPNNVIILNFNHTGHLMWNKTLGGSDTDNVGTLLIYQNELILSGLTQSTDFPQVNSGEYGSKGALDFYLTKMNFDGEISSSVVIGGSDSEIEDNILINQKGNIFLSGTTESDDYYVHDEFQSDFAGTNDIVITIFGEGEFIRPITNTSGPFGSDSTRGNVIIGFSFSYHLAMTIVVVSILSKTKKVKSGSN